MSESMTSMGADDVRPMGALSGSAGIVLAPVTRRVTRRLGSAIERLHLAFDRMRDPWDWRAPIWAWVRW